MPLMIPHATLSPSLESSDLGRQNRSVIFFMHNPSKRGMGVIVAAATGTTAKKDKDTLLYLFLRPALTKVMSLLRSLDHVEMEIHLMPTLYKQHIS